MTHFWPHAVHNKTNIACKIKHMMIKIYMLPEILWLNQLKMQELTVIHTTAACTLIWILKIKYSRLESSVLALIRSGESLVLVSISAISEIGNTITILSRVSSIAILTRYWKFIWNVGPQAHQEGCKVVPHPTTFWWPHSRLEIYVY